QIELEDLLEAADQLRVRDRKNDLHPVAQIPTHQVGAARVDLLSTPVSSVVDSAVFEESPHDTGYTDVLTDSWHAGSQTAESAHQQVHPHSRLGRPVKQPDHSRVF